MIIPFLEDEYWYGGVVHMGASLPIGPRDDVTLHLLGGKEALDQYSPLFFSSKGRLLHSTSPFDVRFCKGQIEIDDAFSVTMAEGYHNLRGAQQAAKAMYFRTDGKMPDKKFFRCPQYNTWIELMYNQNQEDILQYAKTLVEAGMPAGVLMIDEGWAPDYGVYEFSSDKFSDPKAMVDALHAMGFSVMLWITPMISPDGDCYRELRHTDLLLHDKDGKIAVREWWNGFSAVLDFTNPATCAWYEKKLRSLMERYGIDGFKFDSGDTYLYRADDKAYVPGSPNDHTTAFNRFGERFAFNEFRNVWNMGGAPLVCRLQDKQPAWDTTGLATLLPNMLTGGLLGYYYGCPDMIGGGAYGAFLSDQYQTDEELYLRWLAASILCPMMQFSISPKRILTPEHFAAVQTLTALRQAHLPTIIRLAESAASTGEPIIRYMEYVFPGQGLETVTDQFMLGDALLVAPILKKGAKARSVRVPDGTWKTAQGQSVLGPATVTLSAELDELIVLTKEY